MSGPSVFCIIIIIIIIISSRNAGSTPSGRTMALESTRPLTEMSARDIPLGGKGGWCVRLTTLPP